MAVGTDRDWREDGDACVGLPIAVFSGAVLCSSVLMALMLLCTCMRPCAHRPRAHGRRFRTSVDTVDDVMSVLPAGCAARTCAQSFKDIEP